MSPDGNLQDGSVWETTQTQSTALPFTLKFAATVVAPFFLWIPTNVWKSFIAAEVSHSKWETVSYFVLLGLCELLYFWRVVLSDPELLVNEFSFGIGNILSNCHVLSMTAHRQPGGFSCSAALEMNTKPCVFYSSTLLLRFIPGKSQFRFLLSILNTCLAQCLDDSHVCLSTGRPLYV